MEPAEHGGVVGKGDVIGLDLEVDHVRDVLGAVHADVVPHVGLVGDGLDLLAEVLLDAVQHLSLVVSVHVFQELELVAGDKLELLDLVLADDLFEGVEVEVEAVGEVEAELAGLLDGLAEVVLLELVVEDQVVAELWHLGGQLGT